MLKTLVEEFKWTKADYLGRLVIRERPDGEGHDGRYRVHDPLCVAGPTWLTCEEVRAFCGAAVLGEQIGLVVQQARQCVSA